MKPFVHQVLHGTFVLALFLPLAAALRAKADQPPAQNEAAVEKRVESMLQHMSLAEKIDMIGGKDDFNIRGNARIGFPQLVTSDGPLGVRNPGRGTAYPAGVMLAATWDQALARSEGESLGHDCRARGVHFLLGPGVNITLLPQCGRNFEYFGEDPWLASRLTVNYIQGLQSQGVSATVKHFAANNHESDRMNDSSEVDERTLNEIYFPAFRAAVQEAHAGAVMCAYNRLNGTYCSADKWLLTEVLKTRWGFDGLVMSDWGAVHETLGCMSAGLDLEMPAGTFLNQTTLRPLIASKAVTEEQINDRVRRIFRVAASMGWLDRPQQDASISWDDPRSAAIATEVARAGIVLLKNEHRLLPIDTNQVKTIAVIGPNADPAVTGGGGSSAVTPFHSISTLDGLRQLAGETVKIVSIPTSLGNRGNHYAKLFADSQYEGPLHVDYFAGTKLEGKPVLSQNDTRIDFNWGQTNAFSARLTGKIRPTASGDYLLVVNSDDGARVKLDGKVILDIWGQHPALSADTTIPLQGGTEYAIEIEYYNAIGNALLQFGWGEAPPLLKPSELEQIAAADIAVVCAGFDARTEGEGSDRPFQLPAGQDQLIQMVAKANPRTAVILNSGGSVDLSPWMDSVPGLLQAWYPGQAGGQALAEVLLGKVNPSGKLPQSWEKKWEQAAAYGTYPPTDGKLRYPEGIMMGYRHFDRMGIEPRFAFGFGLSYTDFQIKNLQAKVAGSNVVVTLTVTNTGAREGAEVVQIYIGERHAPVVRPVRELKAFQKVRLNAGESKALSFNLGREAFAFYDVTVHDWVVAPDDFEIAAGNSSRNLPLRTKIIIPDGPFTARQK